MSGFSLVQYVQTQRDVEKEKIRSLLVVKSTPKPFNKTLAYRTVIIYIYLLVLGTLEGIVTMLMTNKHVVEGYRTSVRIAVLTGAIGGAILSAIAAVPFSCVIAYFEEETRLMMLEAHFIWLTFSLVTNFAGAALGTAIAKKIMLDTAVVVEEGAAGAYTALTFAMFSAIVLLLVEACKVYIK
ncbi:hypothetical protein BDQ17DRAFT_1431194 [Cyathus striatus]|nr:hypothetical protein BDQ17DRAFT_1431194 [Cyathus striatus]